jgi:hypothetical protein
MQDVNWKLFPFLAILGFLRGCFEENLLGFISGPAAVEQRNGMPVWFWIFLPLFAPLGTFLFIFFIENRLQFPLLRWLMCNFVFSQEAGYSLGALGRGLFKQDFISTMNGLAALGLSATILFLVSRHPKADWIRERRFRWH